MLATEGKGGNPERMQSAEKKLVDFYHDFKIKHLLNTIHQKGKTTSHG